jgi:L-ectoine synthase
MSFARDKGAVMLIRTMEQIEAEGRVISIGHGKATAVRLLTKADGLSFSISEARGSKAGATTLWYKNHWEANYVRSGSATLEDCNSGQRWQLEPGVLYCVGPLDQHRIIREVDTDMRLISVFSPPIIGQETHDESGAYPPSGELPPRQGRMTVTTLEDVRNAGLEVNVGGGQVLSQRYLNAADQMGFSFSSVKVKQGVEADLWYKNHWEGNLVLDGSLEVTHKTSGEAHILGPGALYLVGPNDPHHIKALTDVHAISVFDPPLTGTENHDADGAYPPTGPIPPGPSAER